MDAFAVIAIIPILGILFMLGLNLATLNPFPKRERVETLATEASVDDGAGEFI